MDEKAGLGQDSAVRDENDTGYIGKRTHRLKASAEAVEVVSVYSRIYAVMEAPLARGEQGATRHEDEIDGDKASALDVYLRFKLSPRFERRSRKKSFVDFS